MKKICIIYTGGTIGMVKSENGYAPGKVPFAETMKKISDFSAEGIPEYDVIEFSPLLDSSDITVSEWNKIGRTIFENMENYDGFVVLHGTDTMAYTASALSFMLQNLKKPVVLTGAQIPLCELRSDAKDNLIASMLIAASGKIYEVCLYFAGKLIRGNRAIKQSADTFIAFISPNYPDLAEAGIEIRYRNSIFLDKSSEPCVFTEFIEEPIGVIKIYPGINIGLYEKIITEELRGAVIEAFGSGNIPSYCNEKLNNIIEKAYKNGTIIVICSQCKIGKVNLGTYAVNGSLKNSGLISGKNITTEAAVAKLYYLFSKGYNKEEIRELMGKNICGELDE